MVVWADGRSGICTYGARVTPSGTVLDPNGIQIGPSSTTRYQRFPVVGFDGTNFLVVWSWAVAPYGITARLVDINGQPGTTTTICTTEGVPISLRIAYDGTNYLLVWHEPTSYAYMPIKGQLISENGIPIGTPFVIAEPYCAAYSLGLCFDGTNYCITYSLPSGSVFQLWGRRYSTAGSPVGSPFRISNSSSSQFYGWIVAGANNRYFNVWTEDRGSSGYDIYGNLDIEIGIEDSQKSYLPNIALKSSIVIRTIEFSGVCKKSFDVFDISGRKVGSSKTGRFDCCCLNSGVYFIKVSSGQQFKVVKVK